MSRARESSRARSNVESGSDSVNYVGAVEETVELAGVPHVVSFVHTCGGRLTSPRCIVFSTPLNHAIGIEKKRGVMAHSRVAQNSMETSEKNDLNSLA